MARDTVIRVENVSKTFRLPHEKNNSIKSAAINFYKRNKAYETQQVLNDVSFEIKKGEFFGIVGRNGSGKSTLLKMLAGIYSSSSGNITVNGKLTPFIELGVGFSPELTGRENVFLNGALLGFGRKDMEAMYDDIVEFAELERFMDQKLKNYSSGMQVRLAFSIAIRVQSDILLLDEVLAVGDESFQRKCLDVFENYKNVKQTVVLVTHDMETVRRFCSQALLIDDGNIIDCGDPHKVAEEYSRLNQEKIDQQRPLIKSDKNNDLDISLLDATGKEAKRFDYGDSMHIKLSWPQSKQVQNAGVSIYTTIGECVYATNTFVDKQPISGQSAIMEVRLKIGAGKYYIMAGTFLDQPEKKVDFVTRGPEFTMNAEKIIKGEGITRLNHTWLSERKRGK